MREDTCVVHYVHTSGLTPWYQRPQCAISFMREDTCVVHYVHTSGLTPWYQRPQCAISFIREDTCVVHCSHQWTNALVPKTISV